MGLAVFSKWVIASLAKEIRSPEPMALISLILVSNSTKNAQCAQAVLFACVARQGAVIAELAGTHPEAHNV